MKLRNVAGSMPALIKYMIYACFHIHTLAV